MAMKRRSKDPKSRSEKELLQEIGHKLDVLTGMIAIQGKEPKVQIAILTKLGLSSREIGALLNVHPDSVRHARTR